MPGTETKTDIDYKDAPYRILVDDMSCQHCVAAVEKAVLTVEGVSSTQVKLAEGYVEVSGGLPHEVINAIKEAGYEARPQAKIPQSCLLPEAAVSPDTELEDEADTIETQSNTSEESGNDHSYQINIADMTCTSCVTTVEKAILSVAEVTRAQINLVEKKALITGGNREAVVNAIIDQGYEASLIQENIINNKLILQFQGEEEDQLEALLNELGSDLNYAWPIVSLTTTLHPGQLLLQLKSSGYTASLQEQFDDPHQLQAEKAQLEIRRSWQRAILAGSVGTILMAGEMSGVFPQLSSEGGQLFWLSAALVCLFTMWFSGRNYYNTALKQARHLSSNMDTLVALGTSAAWLSSLIIIINPQFIPEGGNHLYLDAAVFILAFLQFGHALEIRAKQTTSKAIGALVQLAPKSAALVLDGNDIIIPVSLLQYGDIIRVKPGETVPIDGEVIAGSSTINESMLTGESLPVAKHIGDEVIGGTSNHSGSLMIKVTRLGDETTLSNIIHMVEQAQLSKPPIANLVDKISAVFVPIVIVISIASFFSWLLFAPQPPLAFAFTAAIAVLVIACPCALGLATPIAIMVGTARAAQLGILIKNSDALQSAAALTHLVVDKTGTLTEGKPSITEIHCISTIDETQLLQFAVSLETGSEHPLAEAISSIAEEKKISTLACNNFQALSGRGITGDIAQQHYFLGNLKLISEQGLQIDEKWQQTASDQAEQGGTPIWLSSSNELLGLLIVKDQLREDSSDAIKTLHQQGIQIIMCTGDHHKTADAIGKTLAIDHVYSELLPQQKLEVISDLQQQGYKVGMVGDGVNDAPALARANTGFAIGSGTDIAIEHADITLVGNSLKSVSTAIAVSSATLRNIKENLFGAFIYNLIGIPLAAGLFYPLTGWLLNPMFASFAMAMSSVTVVTNANRLRFFREPSAGE